jgi:hypothetical protein
MPYSRQPRSSEESFPDDQPMIVAFSVAGYFFDEDLRAARLAFLGAVGWLGVARPVSSCTARSSKGESSLPRKRERTNTKGPRCHARRSSSTSRP